MSSLKLTRVLGGVLCAGLLCGAGVARADTPSPPANKPNNTAQNDPKRSPEGRMPMADQSSNQKSDLYLTAEIRRAVMAQKDFSVAAHNVKIIANAGMVTLKGPVKTEREKLIIEKKASDIAGPDRVYDQIEVER